MKKLAWIVALGMAACGGADDGGPGVELLAGFNPPAPLAGEVQIVSPIVRDIPAGSDITYCTFLDYYMDSDEDIVDFRAFQSTSGHHSILYALNDKKAPGTRECTEEDMLYVRFLGATAGEGVDAPIPEGVGFRVTTGTQLMVQTHWINASDHAIDGQAAFNLRVQPPSEGIQVSDLLTTATTNIRIPAGGEASVKSDCVVGQEMRLWALGGHAHEFGRQVTVSHRSVDAPDEAAVLWQEDWNPSFTYAPPLLTFPLDAPLVLQAGDTLSVECTYFNDTAEDIRFPREMCGAFGFWFPADRQIDCTNGHWPD